MTIFFSIVIGILAAAAGAVAGGFVASLAVGWYRITSREGASGYFIATIGLLGIIAGMIIGISCGISMDAATGVGFLKGLGLALGIIFGLASLAAGISRALADVPPTIDGETLYFIVEAKCPASQTTSPAIEPGDSYVRLGAMSGKTVRKLERGPLWTDQARFEDGRWIARGAVELFTERGPRFLEVALGQKGSFGFIVPLPRRPKKKHQAWSDWLPHYRDAAALSHEHVLYRFRVQKRSEPIKVEAVGPFEIVTTTYYFYELSEGATSKIVGSDTFQIRCGGNAFSITGSDPPGSVPVEKIDIAATFPSPRPAVLVSVSKDNGPYSLYLLSERDGRPQIDLISEAGGNNTILDLSTDAPRARYFSGRLPNRRVLSSGLFRIGVNGVLDTRTLAVHRFTWSSAIREGDSVPPLGVSPDGRSFVRFVFQGDTQDRHALAATDFVANRVDVFPIERQRMHYTKLDQINPAWMTHHFAWEPDAAGVDRLVERKDVMPLPYHGELNVYTGNDHNYRLDAVGAAMRTALEDFLIAEFKAERVGSDSTDYEHEFRVNGSKVLVGCSTDSRFVNLSMESGKDSTLVDVIGKGFDAALATGKHDALFEIS